MQGGPAIFQINPADASVRKSPKVQIPDKRGIYLLFEKKKLLYTRATEDMRREIEIHRDPKKYQVIAEKLWLPDPDHFAVEFAALTQPIKYLQAIERKIIEERHPLFNVPRSTA